jgi:sulfur carrier protein ThiS
MTIKLFTGNYARDLTAIKNYTLVDFLRIWGLDFNGKTVNASVNGKPIADFANHVLRDGEQIRLDLQ